ncbi:hypothetical protein EBT25_10460 [bacterium]|nr:hypothetical protein [bacterium]
MNVTNLFATPISVTDDLYNKCDLAATLANKAVNEADEQPEWDCNIATTFSVNNNFHTTPKLEDLFSIIEDEGNQYSQYIFGRKSKILHCWANRASHNQYQEYHNHLGGRQQFSAVFYPQAQENEKLIFHSPFQNIRLINRQETVQIHAKQNRLIVFPTYLAHSLKQLIEQFPKYQ